MRDQYAAANAARQINEAADPQAEEVLVNANADGVRKDDDTDKYDAVYAAFDEAHLMTMAVGGESALSHREAALLAKSKRELNSVSFAACEKCRERGFSLKIVEGACSACRRDNGETAAENKSHPALDVRECLKGLTDVEDMLIARIKTYIQVRYTSGRHQSHVINFHQNITHIARHPSG
ncbi:hypothetical protein EST38_g2512 [Candolleomyces aberdarensis]|uniref:Uncharacterized protein n=1 Tax=Candolleomyces aberdarensis TaxID=2316362 RepID=A0A4Q2DS90_9AGAR|nr:hypothetical protein EST38_g2512 [Candolleomyces aberdarensis]